MPISTAEIERTLLSRKLPGLEKTPFIAPHYGGFSIANLPATFARMLGASLPEAAPAIPGEHWMDLTDGLERIVAVLIDATGYLALKRLMESEPDIAFARLARQGRLIPLTSVFPSTTVAALASLWTGRYPMEHGLLGYTLYLKDFGVVINAIAFKPTRGKGLEFLEDWGLEVEEFVPVPGLAELLTPQGVQTHVLIYEGYVKSALSRILHRGAEDSCRGYINSSDMWVLLRRMLGELRGERALINVYWGGLDGISHRYGPDDETWKAELRNLAFSLEEEFLKRLDPQDREGTLFVLISDHGQVSTPPEKAIWANKHPTLWNSLALPPTGEARIAYLHVRDGKREQVRSYLEDELGSFVVMDSERALEMGLFGTGQIHPDTPSRIGDLIAFARRDAYIIWGYKEPELRGRHGGLTPEEMLVPLLMVRLDGMT